MIRTPVFMIEGLSFVGIQICTGTECSIVSLSGSLDILIGKSGDIPAGKTAIKICGHPAVHLSVDPVEF